MNYLVRTEMKKTAKAFFKAVEKNNLPKVQDIIDSGFDVNTKDEVGYSALNKAILLGHSEIVEYLVSNNADIKKSVNDRALLHSAAFNGHIDIVECLLHHGADVNAIDKDTNWTPLHSACLSNHKDMVEYLLNCGADLNVKDKSGSTPLISLFLNDNMSRDPDSVSIMECLIKHGADLDERTPLHSIWMNRTPLEHAIINGNQDTIDLLLKHRVDVNTMDKFNETPLYKALFGKHNAIAESLLKHGAEVNIRGKYKNKTPLECAIMGDNQKGVDMLLEYGADVNTKDQFNRSPLHFAVNKEDNAITECLLKHGAELNVENSEGETPLQCATKLKVHLNSIIGPKIEK